MTIEEAKGNLIHAIRWNDMPKKKEALDMAIKALEIWDNLFKSYEVLINEIIENEDIKNATKRIDDWCIEQLRGIISDYYADLIIKENEI